MLDIAAHIGVVGLQDPLGSICIRLRTLNRRPAVETGVFHESEARDEQVLQALQPSLGPSDRASNGVESLCRPLGRVDGCRDHRGRLQERVVTLFQLAELGVDQEGPVCFGGDDEICERGG